MLNIKYVTWLLFIRMSDMICGALLLWLLSSLLFNILQQYKCVALHLHVTYVQLLSERL